MTEARWNAALWGVDRWPALIVGDLLQQPPAPARGALIGIGDWRVSVEALLPDDALAVWGIAKWNEQTWTTLRWRDLTPYVRGVQWSRGSDEVYGRPRVGSLDLTLDASDDRFSPWNPAGAEGETVGYFAPGTIVRVGVRSATDTRGGRVGWLPQITAIVDSWGMEFVASEGQDRFVPVKCYETLSALSAIDDNATSPVGAGDVALARFERLLDAAGWPYGFLVAAQNVAAGGYPMGAATEMTANRLAELYQVADASDCSFRSDRTGAAIVFNPEYNALPPDPKLDPLIDFSRIGTHAAVIGFYPTSVVSSGGTLLYIGYAAESFKTSNDKSAIVNDARFARVGGTQQVFEQVASIKRHGRRSLVRNDFLNADDATVLLIATYTTVRRALNTLRVDQIDVDTIDRGDDFGLAALACDVGNECRIYPPFGDPAPPALPYIRGFVRAITHRVTPMRGAVATWQTSFAFDTRDVFNIPGAQLPNNEP